MSWRQFHSVFVSINHVKTYCGQAWYVCQLHLCLTWSPLQLPYQQVSLTEVILNCHLQGKTPPVDIACLQCPWCKLGWIQMCGAKPGKTWYTYSSFTNKTQLIFQNHLLFPFSGNAYWLNKHRSKKLLTRTGCWLCSPVGADGKDVPYFLLYTQALAASVCTFTRSLYISGQWEPHAWLCVWLSFFSRIIVQKMGYAMLPMYEKCPN